MPLFVTHHKKLTNIFQTEKKKKNKISTLYNYNAQDATVCQESFRVMINQMKRKAKILGHARRNSHTEAVLQSDSSLNLPFPIEEWHRAGREVASLCSQKQT